MIQFPITAAEDLVLPGEDIEAFDQLRAGLHAEHRAATPTELLLVEEIVQNSWRVRRFRQLEAANLALPSPELSSLAFIHRALAAAERSCHRALAALIKLQRERGFVPSKTTQSPEPDYPARSETGFVPEKTAPTDPAALDWDETFDLARFHAAKEKHVSEETPVRKHAVSG